MAQGWPSQYKGVMLQGFYWDSFDASKWAKLQNQAKELGQFFDLVWLPQSGNCGGQSMGYDDLYWFTDYNSSFGTESELRSLIQAFKDNGIGTIADVVINHRKNKSNWVDFPSETYKGVTYELTSTDICSDDDGGATKQWADQHGYSLSPNKDTGEGWGGMRDLDHKSENVQTSVKAYLKMLLEDLGYTGFRYDMVKGYSGSYTKLYNDYSKPTYSVGECWDGTTTIRNWIDATEKTSAAFDFQFRYTVRNAINRNDWTQLGKQNDGNWPLMSNNYNNGEYRRYAVTFVENHDTERRSNAAQDPIVRDTLAANAYLLAMPGTPCVFMTHWMACKKDIKMMINARKAAGIHNESTYANHTSSNGYYGVRVTGDKAQLLCVVGNNAASYTPNDQWQKIFSGHHYAYYLNKQAELAWIDLPSGQYDGTQTATLTTVSNSADAKIVYTTDGSTPTAQSQQASSGTTINIPVGTTILKAALLIGGTVGQVMTCEYEVSSFQPYDFTAYVNTDEVGWTSVNFWTWGGDGSHSPANSSWPGDKVTSTVQKDGRNWYAKTYRINSADDRVNFVFSTNSGSPQTVDINDIYEDTFFVVSSETEGGKNKVNATPASISHAVADQPAITSTTIYTADGRLVRSLTSGERIENVLQSLPKGLYIANGKKFVVK
jgi:alpha-amylase